MGKPPAAGGSDDEDGLGGGVPLMIPYSSKFRRTSFHTIQQEAPDRQPFGPPTGHDAMRVAGFAQFIRRHASPPDRRVTAGGRVVPVGPASPPPTFHMEFIDRIIQAAEEVQQDPSPERQIQPISWLETSEASASHDASAGHDASASHDASISPNANASFEASASSAEPVTESTNVHASSAEPQSKKRHRPTMSEQVSTLELPPEFKGVAVMDDGNFLLSLGSRFFRSSWDNDGYLCLEEIQYHVASEEDSSATARRDEKRQYALPLTTQELLDGFPQVRADLPEGGYPRLFMAPLTFPPIDPAGNIVYRHYKLPDGSSQFLPLIRCRVESGADTSQSLVLAKDPRNDATEQSYFPTGVSLSSVGMEDAPIDVSNLSEEDLLSRLALMIEIIEARDSRLKGVERFLAKDSDVMGAHTYKKLIHEKGLHIRVIDKLRKDKEKIIQRLRRDFGSVFPEEEIGYDAFRSVAPVTSSGQDYTGAVVKSQARTRIGDHALSKEASFQFGDLLHPQGMPAPPQSSRHLPSWHSEIHDTGNAFNSGRENLVPYSQQYFDTVTARPNDPAVNLRYPEEQSGASRSYGFGTEIAIATPNEDDELYPQGDPFKPVNVSQQAPGRAKAAVTIRRPDGTPIDFKQLHHVPKSENMFGAAHNQRPGGEYVQGNKVLLARTPERNPPPNPRVYQTPVSYHDNSHMQQPEEKITWGRLPNESREEYNDRLERQRERQNHGLARKVRKNRYPDERTLPSRASFTNENQRFRRPRLPEMPVKAALQEPVPSVYNVAGHIMAPPAHDMSALMPVPTSTPIQPRQFGDHFYHPSHTMPSLRRKDGFNFHRMGHVASQMSLKNNESEQLMQPEEYFNHPHHLTDGYNPRGSHAPRHFYHGQQQ